MGGTGVEAASIDNLHFRLLRGFIQRHVEGIVDVAGDQGQATLIRAQVQLGCKVGVHVRDKAGGQDIGFDRVEYSHGLVS